MAQAGARQGGQVEVAFDVTEPGTHLVGVVQRFPAVPADRAPERTFRMPAWVPGSYKIRDYGREVQDLEARVAGRHAEVRQVGKDAWTVARCAGKAVELRFRAYARELTVDTSHVTSDHAHLFPPTLTLYDAQSRGLPHRVTVRRPRGWGLWSGLETPSLGGALGVAQDYDHLIDCPIECGPPGDYAVARFEVRRKAHRLVVWNPPADMDRDRVARDVRKVVAETARLFGGLPYDHYTFLGHVAVDHHGGLEHRNSTLLGIDPLHLVQGEKLQRDFLPLVAHEFFHTWNVKRILPRAFQPYDLQQEGYTDLLWLFEGFTSYYELPLLRRSGVLDEEAFGKLVGDMVKHYEAAVGRKRRPVAEASRLAWSLLYQPHEHNVNRNVSYYTKGLFVGLCLDAHLRRRGVKEGLDAVMRLLWERHGKTGEGVPEDAFPGLVREATGVNCGAVLRKWVQGTGELPLDASLRTLGFDVKREHEDPKRPVGLGVTFKKNGTVIERIPEDSPAWRVLQPDDEVVAVEGYKWKADRMRDLAAVRGEGAKVRVAVFREGRLRELEVPLRTLARDKVTVKPRKGDAAAARRRKAWLGA